MKHSFRQRVINEYGLPVTKVETVNGELGSGILDRNGKEIFEGDIIKNGIKTYPVVFRDGALQIEYQSVCIWDLNSFEIVGHVDD